MKQIIINVLGVFLEFVYRIFCSYKVNKLYKSLHYVGKDSHIAYPFSIVGVSNIEIGNNVSIRSNCVMTALNRRIIIKNSVIVATDLIISTGNHQMIPGRFTGSITNEEKGEEYDDDVVINDDVWIASRVTILKGVNVGRGAVIAAGSVVNKNVLPYSVVAGVPAKFIKFKWSISEILFHEQKLYKPEDRFTLEELLEHRKKYEKDC